MPINRKEIINTISKIEINSDENGLISNFNVLINQLPTSLWNDFAERLVLKTDDSLLADTEGLLVNAAQECGYHTGYGIMGSELWASVVTPMVNNVEDVLHGAFAVLTAMGWAQIEIVELIPNEKMVARAYSYYEADFVKIGTTDRKNAYMIRGICAAFMALAYSGEYDISGALANNYSCEQVKGIESGDDYGEFVVTKTTTDF